MQNFQDKMLFLTETLIE